MHLCAAPPEEDRPGAVGDAPFRRGAGGARRAGPLRRGSTTRQHPDACAAKCCGRSPNCSPQRVVVTEAGEYRVVADMRGVGDQAVGDPPDTRFICSIAEFRHWATGRNGLRMEFFYRDMRRRDRSADDADGEPEGGRWNFDAENRKRLPRGMTIPPTTALRAGRDHAGGHGAGAQPRSPTHFGDRRRLRPARHGDGCRGRPGRLHRPSAARLRRLAGRDADRRSRRCSTR